MDHGPWPTLGAKLRKELDQLKGASQATAGMEGMEL